MYAGASVLAIVPARAGSRALPDKNARVIAGQSLLAWTLEAGLGARCVDRVLVTTDSPRYAELARSCGAGPPFLRPAELARDTSSVYDAIDHALDWLFVHEARSYDVLVLLQPTSPLRRAEHIERAVETLVDARDPEATLVSVSAAPAKLGWLLRANGAYVDRCMPPAPVGDRRQDQPALWLPNGALFLAMLAHWKHTFWSERTRPFAMDAADSIDVDSPEELAEAERLLLARQRGR